MVQDKKCITCQNQTIFFLWEVTHCEQWDFCLQNREGGVKMHGMIWCEIVKRGTSKNDGMWFKGELVKGWNYESVDEMVKGCNGERVK